MKNFELWLDSNKARLSETVYGLFSDSLKCYKFDILRPSYQLAYQGMMMYIREDVLRSPCPKDYPEHKWNSYIKAAKDEDRWDSTILDMCKTGMGGGDTCIQMPIEARKKFEYWKDIRNICAHYKEYNFIAAHILTLYAFIEQYLFMISVKGGVELLLEELKERLDYIRHPEPIDYNWLIDTIERRVPNEQLLDTLDAVSMLIYTKRSEKVCVEFMHLAITSPIARIQECVHDMLSEKGTRSYLFAHLAHYPADIFRIYDNDADLREFADKRLVFMYNKMEILVLLLQSCKFDKEFEKRLLLRVLRNAHEGSRYLEDLSEENLAVLRRHGYFDLFMSEYMNRGYTSNRLKAICYETNFWISHIEKVEMTPENAKQIQDVMREPAPYTLVERFESLLAEDADFKKRYEDALKETE